MMDEKERALLEKLKKSEEKFRIIFDNTNDSIFVHTLDGKILEFNDTACKKLGYTKQELLRLSPQKVDSPRFAKNIPAHIKKVLKNGSSIFETAHITKSGKEIPTEVNAKLIEFSGQKAIISICRDITERKKAEEELKESEEKYKQLFRSSKDAIMTLAPPMWNFTSGNPSMVAMFGAKNEKDFISKKPWELSPKYQPDGQLSPVKAKAMIEKAMKEGSNYFEWTHKRINGEDFFATILLSKVEEKNRSYLQATVRDVTEQKKAEEKLMESEEKSRDIIETSTEAFWIVDLNGKILHVNDAFCKLLGYSKSELIKLKISDMEVVENPAEIKKHIGKIIKAGHDIFYTRHRKKDGQIIDVEVSATYSKNKNLFYVFTKDVSEKKRIEQELKIVAESAFDLVRLAPEEDIYGFVADRLKELVGNAVVSVSAIDSKNQIMTIKKVAGFTDAMGKILFPIIKRTNLDLVFDLQSMKSTIGRDMGHLNEVRGGLYDIFFRTFPKPACLIIEKLIGLKKMYSIDLVRHGVHYGVATILMREEGEINSSMIETFINQASMVIERKKAEEEIKHIAKNAMDFVELSPKADIYEFIGKKLKEITGNSVVAVSSADEESHQIEIRSIVGLSKEMEETFYKYTNKKTISSNYDIKSVEKIIRKGKSHIIDLKDGLYDALMHSIPKSKCRSIEKKLGVKKTFIIDFLSGKRYLGSASIFMLSDYSFDKTIIDSLINEVSIVLERIKIQDELNKYQKNLEEEVQKRTLELNKQESFLNSIVENVPNMIFVKDAKELKFELFNRAGEDLLGYKKKDLIGKSDYDFFSKKQADFFIEKDRETLNNKHLVDIPEEPIDTKTGKRFLHTRKIPILDENGNSVHLLGISEDITERKKVEEELKERNLELETFNKIAVGRELRMVELKKKIQELEYKLANLMQKNNEQK